MRRVGPVLLCVLLMAAEPAWPSAARPQPDAAAQKRVARGRYLVQGVAHCFSCHSEVNEADGVGQPLPGTKGGGRVMSEDESGIALPYRVVAPNITPDRETGAGAWSDEQFVRALRQGIGHDGRTLFRMMPYLNFHFVSDEDLASIIAYIRSIPPLHHALPKTMLPPAVAAALKPLPPQAANYAPELATPAQRGEYLVHLGNCTACHTPRDETAQPLPPPLPGMYLAGGRMFLRTFGEVATPNITPDSSGISYYTREQFIQVIRTGRVGARKLKATMPWSTFRNLSDADLGDIYAYLRSVPPVRHRVDNTEPPTYCKVCKGKHGYGERN